MGPRSPDSRPQACGTTQIAAQPPDYTLLKDTSEHSKGADSKTDRVREHAIR